MTRTRTQNEVFKFLEARCQTGPSPSMREIADFMQCRSSGAAHRIIVELEKRGYVRRNPHKARSIEIVPPMGTVKLNAEIHSLVSKYATEHGIKIETAANELLRGAIGAA